jgi:hypothetical protein
MSDLQVCKLARLDEQRYLLYTLIVLEVRI